MKSLYFGLCALLFSAISGHAQSFPQHQTLFVNDYANVIEDAAETRITDALRALLEETGIEATVLTINSRAEFGDTGPMEPWVTNLFNSWGVGNQETNDGILLFVSPNDRELRIELGSAYRKSYDDVAEEIVAETMLPLITDARMSQAIEEGTLATIDRIAYRKARLEGGLFARAKDTASSVARKAASPQGLIIFLFAGITGLMFRSKISDARYRFRRCPECGQRGLKRTREVIEKATHSTKGRGIITTTCANCTYRREAPYITSVKSDDTHNDDHSGGSGGSFGGGSSSGGGASGRW